MSDLSRQHREPVTNLICAVMASLSRSVVWIRFKRDSFLPRPSLDTATLLGVIGRNLSLAGFFARFVSLASTLWRVASFRWNVCLPGLFAGQLRR